MKKLFILLLVLNCSRLFGREFSISVQPFISYNNDTLTYSIYDGPVLVSRLDWATPYLFKPGVGLSMRLENLGLDFSNAVALPFACGTMSDSDWYTQNIKTNLSQHKITADFCYDLKIKLKYQIQLQNEWALFPTMAFYYSYSSFKGTDGVGWCGDSGHTGLFYDVPWNNKAAVKVNKFGIDFYNNTYIFYLGAAIEKSLGVWQFSSSLLVSPYIYVSSIDHHLNNSGGRYFLLLQSAYFSSMSVDLSCACHINQKNKISLAPEFSFCREIKGIFYSGKEKSKQNLIDQPCSFNFTKFSVSVAWSVEF